MRTGEPSDARAVEPFAERLFERHGRLLSLPIVAGTGTVLGVARWLRPSPLGHGTHLQLGLGRCSILDATGYPCPMCGMTTTFAFLAHLDPVAAIQTQPFGLVLFALTVVAFAVGLAELLQPRNRWKKILKATAPYDGRLALTFTVLMVGGWLVKVHQMRGLW